jgi:hypothetical protein
LIQARKEGGEGLATRLRGNTGWRCSVAIGILAFVVGIASVKDATAREDSCLRPTQTRIASGVSPESHRWTISSTARSAAGCSRWLLEVRARPLGGTRGSWREAWSIPAGGHLTNAFGIDAIDEERSRGRVISGVTGPNVATLELQSVDGGSRSIRTRPVRPGLAAKRPWLRGLRYFILFYPDAQRVVRIRLVARKGEVLATSSGQEGRFRKRL